MMLSVQNVNFLRVEVVVSPGSKDKVLNLLGEMKELITSQMAEPKCGYEFDEEFGLVKGVSKAAA